MYNRFMEATSQPIPSESGITGISRMFSRAAAPYWIMFAIALGIRIVHQLLVSRADSMYGFLLQGGDNYTYDRWANEIAQQFWLGWDRIPFFHGPLYPYFLSLIYLRFGHHHDPAAWTQRLLGAVSVVLIFYLARRIFGKKAGWLAGLAAALCPL
ncbi:MAG TPA: glycosyltransferase family 39 protein, partial [Candidatus Hydrogenedentes bacterium]|nr:glycosyltransferase family 39 protein [Candidatus Hydrogenedentota bacterium]